MLPAERLRDAERLDERRSLRRFPRDGVGERALRDLDRLLGLADVREHPRSRVVEQEAHRRGQAHLGKRSDRRERLGVASFELVLERDAV
ncbi:MAG TPA: hypothetical protein VGM56_25845, partial [Byssovorax sp.]